MVAIEQWMKMDDLNVEETWFGSICYRGKEMAICDYGLPSGGTESFKFSFLALPGNISEVKVTTLHFAALDRESEKVYIGRHDIDDELVVIDLAETDSEKRHSEIEVDVQFGKCQQNRPKFQVTPSKEDEFQKWMLATTSSKVYAVLNEGDDYSKIHELWYDYQEEVYHERHSFPMPTSIRQVEGGNNFLIFRSSKGHMFSMGVGIHGELGVGVVTEEKAPVLIEDLIGRKIKRFAAQGWCTVALDANENCHFWGWETIKGEDGKIEDRITDTPRILDLEDLAKKLPEEKVFDVVVANDVIQVVLKSDAGMRYFDVNRRLHRGVEEYQLF